MAYIQERRTKTGSKSYRAQVRIKGQPPLCASFSRKTDAKEWAQATEAAIREGRYFRTREADRHTFGDMIDRYVKTILPQKNQSNRHSQRRLLKWWKEQLGHKRLSEVTSSDIADCRDVLSQQMTRRGTRISPTTVTHYLAALSHVFTIAIDEWEWLQHSPMRRVRKPKLPRGRVRYLSDEEREQLLKACQESNHEALYTIVVLALSTGMRKSEILYLTWNRVDLARGFILLGSEDTKNGETRIVPLASHARDLLAERARIRRIDTPLVFPSNKRWRGLTNRPVQFQNAWNEAVTAAGITDFRFHDLRHCAASYLAMGGASPSLIAEVLGHKTLQMVKRYAHLSDVHIHQTVTQMNDRIFANVTDSAATRASRA